MIEENTKTQDTATRRYIPDAAKFSVRGVGALAIEDIVERGFWMALVVSGLSPQEADSGVAALRERRPADAVRTENARGKVVTLPSEGDDS